MAPELLRRLIRIAVGIVLFALVVGQCRKPRWWLGRLFARLMNRSHSSVTDWGLQQVAIDGHSTILDVGCGGGRTIEKLAAIAPQGRVCGIDYSPASIEVARQTNEPLIEAGRVAIQQGSVSQLPYPDFTFDVVTAVETHYYWPDPVADVRETFRVLEPGGQLVIIAETYRGRRFDALYFPVMMLLRATYLTVDQHRALLAEAGFEDIAVSVERSKGWICCVGRRPLPPAAA